MNFFKVEEVGKLVIGGVSIRRLNGLCKINKDDKTVEPLKGTVIHGGG